MSEPFNVQLTLDPEQDQELLSELESFMKASARLNLSGNQAVLSYASIEEAIKAVLFDKTRIAEADLANLAPVVAHDGAATMIEDAAVEVTPSATPITSEGAELTDASDGHIVEFVDVPEPEEVAPVIETPRKSTAQPTEPIAEDKPVPDPEATAEALETARIAREEALAERNHQLAIEEVRRIAEKVQVQLVDIELPPMTSDTKTPLNSFGVQ